jgi:hypothetical protein
MAVSPTILLKILHPHLDLSGNLRDVLRQIAVFVQAQLDVKFELTPDGLNVQPVGE